MSTTTVIAEGRFVPTPVPPGPITQVVTPVMALLPTKLAPSKAAGIAAIRVSLVTTDLHVEELDASEQTIIGFVLHPLTDKTNNATGMAITQMGSSGGPSPFTAAQRVAFALIRDELSQFKEPSGPVDVKAGAPAEIKFDWTGFVKALAAAAACAAAAAEGGFNPIADAACVAATTDLVIYARDQQAADDAAAAAAAKAAADAAAAAAAAKAAADAAAADADQGDGDGDGDGGDGGDPSHDGDPTHELN
jgi:hypothetical protein